MRIRADLPIGSNVSVKLAPGAVVRRANPTFPSALMDLVAVLAQRPHVGHMPFSHVCFVAESAAGWLSP